MTPGNFERAPTARRTANRRPETRIPATRNTVIAIACSAAFAAEAVSAMCSARMTRTIESIPNVMTRPGRIRAVQSNR